VIGVNLQNAPQAVDALVSRVHHAAHPQPGCLALWIGLKRLREQLPGDFGLARSRRHYSLLEKFFKCCHIKYPRLK
jgi:hypothetical protein